jgi:hypothetical protein
MKSADAALACKKAADQAEEAQQPVRTQKKPSNLSEELKRSLAICQKNSEEA